MSAEPQPMVRAGSFILGLECHFEPRQASPSGDGRTNLRRAALLPVCEAGSSPQVAVPPRVSRRADAEISSLSRLDAGGVAGTGPRRALASV